MDKNNYDAIMFKKENENNARTHEQEIKFENQIKSIDKKPHNDKKIEQIIKEINTDKDLVEAAKVELVKLAICKFSDKYKADPKFLKNFDNDYDREQLISTMDRPDFIIEVIKRMDDNSRKLVVAEEKFGKDSNAYRTVFNLFGSKRKKQDIEIEEQQPIEELECSSIEVEEVKLEENTIEKTEPEKDVIVQNTIQMEEKSEETVVDEMKIPDEIQEIINLDSDTQKILRVPFIRGDWGKALVISSLKSDKLKIKLLGNLRFEGSRAKVISTLDDNKLKEEFKKHFKYEQSVEMVDRSMPKVEETKEEIVDEQLLAVIQKRSKLKDLVEKLKAQVELIKAYKAREYEAERVNGRVGEGRA